MQQKRPTESHPRSGVVPLVRTKNQIHSSLIAFRRSAVHRQPLMVVIHRIGRARCEWKSKHVQIPLLITPGFFSTRRETPLSSAGMHSALGFCCGRATREVQINNAATISCWVIRETFKWKSQQQQLLVQQSHPNQIRWPCLGCFKLSCSFKKPLPKLVEINEALSEVASPRRAK